jgi:hypothetical protein
VTCGPWWITSRPCFTRSRREANHPDYGHDTGLGRCLAQHYLLQGDVVTGCAAPHRRLPTTATCIMNSTSRRRVMSTISSSRYAGVSQAWTCLLTLM